MYTPRIRKLLNAPVQLTYLARLCSFPGSVVKFLWSLNKSYFIYLPHPPFSCIRRSLSGPISMFHYIWKDLSASIVLTYLKNCTANFLCARRDQTMYMTSKPQAVLLQWLYGLLEMFRQIFISINELNMDRTFSPKADT